MNKLEIKSMAELILAIQEMQIPLEEITESTCSTSWDRNSKTFHEMGLDELDVIRVVLEIESKFNLNIWDYVVTEMIETNPQKLVAARRRSDALGKLGL